MDAVMTTGGASFGFCDSLVCFSHLRWSFVYQRPQHLMTRFARHLPVYFVEEPFFSPQFAKPELCVRTDGGVTVVAARLPEGMAAGDVENCQRVLLDSFLAGRGLQRPVLWYYTPMSLGFSDHLPHAAIVYDCMDELTGFLGAPPKLRDMEAGLMARADVVFTGGYSLFEAKRNLHPNVHPFPSGVDAKHFRAARRPAVAEPADQRTIPHPRLGFYGVIDERLDVALIDRMGALRPDWHIVLIGPVVKIDPASLPQRPNIHYLGLKSYDDLPAYVAGWDVALMPFAINAATRFISPTKTPEYLAAGRPVVSTPIADVVRDYGQPGLVAIAEDAEGFAAAIDAYLAYPKDQDWLETVEVRLRQCSWDATWEGMTSHLGTVARPTPALPAPAAPQVRLVSAVPRFDYLIVGAGFSGAVLAERLAADAGKRVLVVDRRPHIGGNAYDTYDDAGILVHRYGPHIFHTNSRSVWDYLSRFTAWRPYEHRVLAHVDGRLVPIPINLTTINSLYGLSLTGEQMGAFLAARAEVPGEIRTARDVVMAAVGRELYEKFFEGYTTKQWGVDPSALDKSVTARIPTRTDSDDRYFQDKYQAMPRYGYTRLFENLLDHPNIKVMFNTDHREVARHIPHDRMIYTGPIDEYFDYRHGPLPYRSLNFRHATLDRPLFQPVAVVNYPGIDVPYTRITEYKHLTGQSHARTSLSFEYPCSGGDPYYPVPTPENAALFKKYQALADATPGVWFVGRLATYRYYNMDQVVAQALTLYQRLAEMDGQTLPRQLPPRTSHA